MGLGLKWASPTQVGWWPTRGPVWDAVARVVNDRGEIGGLFVEAKGRVRELRGRGCRALPASRAAIQSALDDVQAGLEIGPPRSDWTGRCYQPANRLAWLWFARVKSDPPQPFWMLSIYFLGERYGDTVRPEIGPATEGEWRPQIDGLRAEMSLPETSTLTTYGIELFLPALAPPGPGPPRWAR